MMSVLCKKKPSLKQNPPPLEQYQMILHPDESEPESNRTIRQQSRPDSWMASLFSWFSEYIPKQSRRAMWLSKPSTWIRSLRLRLRKITPKQAERTKWLTKFLSILTLPGKVFSRSNRVTLRDIQSALDNSNFDEESKINHDL